MGQVIKNPDTIAQFKDKGGKSMFFGCHVKRKEDDRVSSYFTVTGVVVVDEKKYLCETCGGYVTHPEYDPSRHEIVRNIGDWSKNISKIFCRGSVLGN